MISNATNALKSEPGTPQAALPPAASSASALNSSKDALNITTYSSHTESLYLKYTSRDGDVLELQAQSSEESYSSETVRFSETAKALAAGTDGKATGADADGNKIASAEDDPKAKQLAQLREWAKQVERELVQQQHKLLEQILKQSGRPVDSGDGKFLLLYVDESGNVKKSDGSADAKADEPQVPAYWNAENTSDRIVHFATQMAEISGLDPEAFATAIKDAIGKGFDQANAITGELPGAAGKLNRDTRDLVSSKLSKWLEDRKSEAYNQGAQSKKVLTADVPYGTENNQQ